MTEIESGTTLTRHLMQVARVAAANTETDARLLAEAHIRRFSAHQLRELAVREITGWIDHYRRAEALEVERLATAKRQTSAEAERAARLAADREHAFGAWLADPSILDCSRDVADSGAPTVYLSLADYKSGFQRWLGHRFNDWYARGCASAERADRAGLYARRGQETMFAADFHPEGPKAWYSRERARNLAAMIERISAEVRLETTDELLNTVFALGDGRKTTWGRATVEDHEQRLGLLTRNATGVVETAARHRSAVQMIRDAGVTCLADLGACASTVTQAVAA